MTKTNAFAMRRQNTKLREGYQVILNELAESARKKNNAYKDYLYKLNSILPRGKKSAVSDEILAAQLSNDEEERKNICQSIRSFASNAEQRRYSLKYNSDYELKVAFPDLYTTQIPIIKHYAELDEDGNIIRKWNTETTETRYYIEEEG